jgi:hypothetical protein
MPRINGPTKEPTATAMVVTGIGVEGLKQRDADL